MRSMTFRRQGRDLALTVGLLVLCDGLDVGHGRQLTMRAIAQDAKPKELENPDTDFFGSDLAPAGDIDADGVLDIAVSHFIDKPKDRSRFLAVYTLSGKDGHLISRVLGPDSRSSLFGGSLALLGDITGDSRPDLAIGDPGHGKVDKDQPAFIRFLGGLPAIGAVFVVHADTPNQAQELPLEYRASPDTGLFFGAALLAPGPLTKNGPPVLVVGSPGASSEKKKGLGMVAAYSLPPKPLWEVLGTEADSHLGSTLACCGDINGDGVADILVGLPALGPGEVRALSGDTGKEIRRWRGPRSNGAFGRAIAALGDVDGDSVPDFAVSSPDAGTFGKKECGAVYVMSSRKSKELSTILGDQAGAHLGAALAATLSPRGEPTVIYSVTGRQGSAPTFPQVIAIRAPTGEPLWTVTGSPSSGLGFSIKPIGDLNGDGFQEVGVGARGEHKVYVFSSKDGTLLLTLQPPAPDAKPALPLSSGKKTEAEGLIPLPPAWGTSVCGLGDANGDGRGDFAVGGPFRTVDGRLSAGQVNVYSGKDTAVIYHLKGLNVGGLFGLRLSSIADLDGDKCNDLLIAEPGFRKSAGRVTVVSGKTGALLRVLEGADEGDRFGGSIVAVADLNGDGSQEIAIGASCSSPAGRVNAGHVNVYSGKDGSLLLAIPGLVAKAKFGGAISPASDHDGDGVPDLLIGAPSSPGASGTESGSALLVSGKTGEVIHQWIGTGFQEWLGSDVLELGDVNGDKIADFIVTSPGASVKGARCAGRVQVLSGSDWSVLRSISGESQWQCFAEAVAPTGDVNKDGIPDFAVADYKASARSSEGCGAVIVYSGKDGKVLRTHFGWETGERLGKSIALVPDLDGDRREDLVIGAPEASVDGAYLIGLVRVFSGRTGGYLYTISEGP